MLLFEFLAVPILYAFLHISNGQARGHQRLRNPMVAGFFSYFVNAIIILTISPFLVISYDWLSSTLIHFVEKFFLPFGIAIAMFSILFHKKYENNSIDSRIAFRSFLLAFLVPFSIQIMIGQGSNPGIEQLFVMPVLWSIVFLMLPLQLGIFEKSRSFMLRSFFIVVLMLVMSLLLTSIQLNSLILSIICSAVILLTAIILYLKRANTKRTLV